MCVCMGGGEGACMGGVEECQCVRVCVWGGLLYGGCRGVSVCVCGSCVGGVEECECVCMCGGVGLVGGCRGGCRRVCVRVCVGLVWGVYRRSVSVCVCVGGGSCMGCIEEECQCV